MNESFSTFLKKFHFRDDYFGYVGIEREHFLVDGHGREIPRSPDFLDRIRDPRWTYELSACQVESRTTPKRDMSAIKLELLENTNNAWRCARELGFSLINREVGNSDMPLVVYPEPRYLAIAGVISEDRLRAACRVTGTHIHIGVSNINRAIVAHNMLLPYFEELCDVGDHSRGERLRLYKEMATQWKPIRYRSLKHFFSVAQEQGFAENPKNCWHLMRISVHGTIELRMFGVTDHVDEIVLWVSRIQKILKGGGLYV